MWGSSCGTLSPSSRAFISSVRSTHPSGILYDNPSALLRYSPFVTAPASIEDSDADPPLPPCLVEDDELEEPWASSAAGITATARKDNRRKRPIPSSYVTTSHVAKRLRTDNRPRSDSRLGCPAMRSERPSPQTRRSLHATVS